MIKPHNVNSELDLDGINHVALVCSDMARTVDFYSNILVHPGVYVRSFYFQDPDGITLEFACWTKEFGTHDAQAAPKTSADRRVPAAH